PTRSEPSPPSGPAPPGAKEAEAKPEDPVKTGKDFAGHLGGKAGESWEDEQAGPYVRRVIHQYYGGTVFTGTTYTHDDVGGHQTKVYHDGRTGPSRPACGSAD